MKKRRSTVIFILGIILFLGMSLFCACGTKNQEQEKEELGDHSSDVVKLKFWEAADEGSSQLELMEEIIEAFKAANPDTTFEIALEPVGSKCKERIVTDLKDAADVFVFADDQLLTLVAGGILSPIENADEIAARNLPAAVEAATVDNTLYAYPLTADNGYFLFYDKSVYKDSDVKTMDSLVSKAAAKGKRVTFDVDNGWYIYSFFGNTGLTLGLNDDGITNFCTWNAKKGAVKGIDVCEGIESLLSMPGFYNAGDEELQKWAKEGILAAGVSGVWVAEALEKAWGNNLGAAKLPTYTAAGKQIQMSSYAGYRLVGVNSLSENEEWAIKFAEFVTDEENQKLRFERCGQGPSNIQAASSDSVKNSVALKALIEQSDYSNLQRIGNLYWDPAAKLGASLEEGSDELQKLLDDTVKQITALPSD